MLLIDAIRVTWPDLEWTNIVVAFVTIAVTYTIFAMMGFGSALIAAPVLALRIPLTSVVPLLAVLDLTAALVNIGRLGSKVDRSEILRLAPLMACGSAAGIFLLFSASPRLMLLGLGVFVIGYSLYRLFFHLNPATFRRIGSLPLASLADCSAACSAAANSSSRSI